MQSREAGAIRVVPIREEHIEGFHACLDAVARERIYLAFLQAPPLDATREFVCAHIAQGDPHFVATAGDGRVVGWCGIDPKTQEGFKHVGQLGMGVDSDFRRRGIGMRLMRTALNMANQIGLERIELEVLASNLPAIELYRKAGFVVEGVQKKARKIDARYEDIVFMALLF